ncbi:glutaredoxin family protein [Ornithinimicrobium cryptoxanthini]|uniref:glutaredoxin family protein n=1 Tax=Ornithinimicrobium cryptoxanthini TaxID=2934161 RepID=UPI0021177270|nr:glutaredoxin family protein [Ornithinimicrobium cryptoxanthini]
MRWLRRGAGETEPRVTLVDRVGCHLCDEAAAVLDQVRATERGADWVRVDVDSSPHLLEAYDDLVPVVLVDGEPIAQWTVTPAQVRAALRRRRPTRR